MVEQMSTSTISQCQQFAEARSSTLACLRETYVPVVTLSFGLRAMVASRRY